MFAFPSFHEGFGLPLIEAMACHVPVVASQTSAFPEIAQNAALYFNPHEPDKSLACKLNHKGYRSVGQALSKNPLLIIIPCHRVLSSDGGLRGFGAGLEVKDFLLRLEKGEVSA